MEGLRANRPQRTLTLPMLRVSFGLTEANVAVRGVADRPIALVAVKARAAAATLLLVNRIAKTIAGLPSAR